MNVKLFDTHSNCLTNNYTKNCVELPTTSINIDQIEILIQNKNDSPQNSILLQDVKFDDHTVLKSKDE